MMRAKRIGAPWKSGQRLGVGVGPSPFSGQLIRWTRRIAAAMDAPWVAVYVETSAALDEDEKRRLTKNLSLARQLGAEVVMTTGDDVAGALLEAAREQGVTQMVVGKPFGNRLVELLKGGSLASRLIRRGGDIDVHVVGGAQGSGGARARRPWSRLGRVRICCGTARWAWARWWRRRACRGCCRDCSGTWRCRWCICCAWCCWRWC